MNEFVIVRHGNTFDSGDTLLRVGARTDLPLSKSGQAQAMALGDHFVDKFPDGFSQATSSPLLRTRQTAEAILSVYDSPPLLRTEAFLTEVDYGPDEGQAEEKVVARLGPDALALWESSAVPPADWLVDTAQLRKDWRTFFATTNDNGEPSRTLVVTSNGIARFALDVIQTGRNKVGSLKLKTGAYGLIRVDGADINLEAWNIRP